MVHVNSSIIYDTNGKPIAAHGIVRDITKETIKNEKFALVEKLAEVIAQKILVLNQIIQVRVRLSKPAPPIPDFTGSIVIDITRKK